MKKVLLFLLLLNGSFAVLAQPEILHPGVYVEETSTLPAQVAQVETAIPAFIGFTEKGPVNKPTLVTNMTEFVNLFGKAFPARFDVEISSSSGTLEMHKITRTSPEHFYLYYALRHYFMNGGGKCYIMSVGHYPDRNETMNASVFTNALDLIKGLDEVTLLVFPDALFLSHAQYYEVVDHALAQCADLKDRFTLIDLHTSELSNNNAVEAELKTAANFKNALLNGNTLRFGAAYTPYLNTTYSFEYKEGDVTLFKKGDLKTISLGDKIFKKNYPMLVSKITNALSKEWVTLPPSATMAGIYCKVDQTRGVWKAPANVSLAATRSLSVDINDHEQESLNADPVSGRSINAIRNFSGRGILVWGARTLAGNDNEWRYVPVRRLFNMVEESVRESTQYVVFEPNDANTWAGVKGLITNYLTALWREGALQGAKPEDAFFVKAGLGETMTAQDILQNRMNIEIGMAVVRPAEFIMLRIEHKAGQ